MTRPSVAAIARWSSLCLTCVALVFSSPALAERPAPSLLPAEKLEAMSDLLRHGDVALIESEPAPSRRLRQIAVMTLVAAPPKVVHDVVADLSHYPEFIHNLTRCTVTKNPDGTFDQRFVISYTLINIVGVTRYRFLDGEGGAGPIEFEAVDPNDKGRFRWDFHAVPGGTVVVFYGYTDVLHSNGLIRTAVKQVPTMEHGLALGAQLVQLRGVKLHAELLARKLSPLTPPRDLQVPAKKAPGFGFLLDRGQVVVLRYSPTGRLSDLSLLDRSSAPRDKVEATVEDVSRYRRLMDAVKSSEEIKRDPGGLTFTQKINLPVASWESRYLLRSDGKGGIDVGVIEGDLAGARYRFDLSSIPFRPPAGATTTVPTTAPSTQASENGTLIVLRASQDSPASSLVLRTLFKQEPLFEPGFAVALALDWLDGVRAGAEGKK